MKRPDPQISPLFRIAASLLFLALICGAVFALLGRSEPSPAGQASVPAQVPTESSPTPAARAAGATDDFAIWRGRYLAAGPDERAALVEAGVRAAEARREEMARLIVSDPAAAVAQALSPDERRALPEAVQAALEELVVAKGFYAVVATCAHGPSSTPADHANCRIDRQAEVDGKIYTAHVFGERLAAVTQENASLYGVAVGKDLALAEKDIVRLRNEPTSPRPVRVAFRGEVHEFVDEPALAAWEAGLAEPVAEPQVAAAGPTLDPAAPPPLPTPPTVAYNEYTGLYSHARGPKTVLVFMVRPSDGPLWNDPPSSTTLNAELDEASRAYFQASYGQTWFGPKYISPGTAQEQLIPRLSVTPVLNLPRTSAEYLASFTQLLFDCQTAARALGGTWAAGGVNDYAFSDRLVVMSNVKMIGSTGLAYVGGKFAWLGNSLNGGVALHEWGHNWGVLHANYWVGNNGIPRNVSGTATEYGDGSDIMGGGGTLFNALFKEKLGFLETARGDVVEVTAPGTYRLYDHTDPYAMNATSRVRALVVPGTDFTNNRIVVGFRHEAGTDGGPNRGDWERTAVQLHTTMQFNGSHFLDTTPGSNLTDDRIDGAVKIGRTYSEGPTVNGTQIYGGLHITPIARGSTAVSGQTHEWMDVTVRFGAPSANAPTGSVSTSNGTPGVGQAVTLTATATDADGDTLAYDWDFGDGTVSLSSSPSQTKSWSAAGFYRVNCRISDTTGHVATASAWINVGNTPYRAPENPASTVGGFSYRYYEGSYASLPDFSTQFPVASGTVSQISIQNRLRNDGFAFVFEGFIDVPTTDVYTFHVEADDGARLYIGNTLVVDGNELRSVAEESTGNIALTQGRHAIRVEYFHQSGTEQLEVSWSTIAQPKTEIPGSAASQTDLAGNNPPTVSLSAPVANSVFPFGSSVVLSATASDANGIAAVRYFEDTTYLGSSSTGPGYSYTWPGTPSGTRTVRAVAYDTTGRYTISNPVSFEVRTPEPTNVISINLTNSSSNIVTAGEKAGAVHFVKGWNNVIGTNASLANLKDQTDSATTAAVSVTFYESYATTATTADGNGKLLKGGLWGRGSGSTRATVTGIPYAEYDVYVYFDAPINPYESTEDITLGSYTVNGQTKYGRNSLVHGDALGDYPSYDGWTGMREATATSLAAPVSEGLGNYVVFRGLSDPTVTLDVQQKRGVNGMQIVQVAPSTARPIIRSSAGVNAVSEGGTTDSYTVELSRAPTSNVTVTISADAQVSTSASSLLFTPSDWMVPRTVTVTAVDDTAVESSPHNGVITHSVTGSGDYAAVPARQMTFAVTDNDTPTVSVYRIGRAREGGATGTLRFVRSQAAQVNAALTANLLFSGNASQTTDVTLSGGSITVNPSTGAGTVVFPAGVSTVDVTVTPTDDSTLESEESLSVAVQSGTGYVLGTANSALLPIEDNDGTVYWTQQFGAGGWSSGTQSGTYIERTFDLNNRKLTFTPDGSPAYYSLRVEPASAFPTASSVYQTHSQLVTATKTYSGAPYQVDLPAKFFGTTYNPFWVSTNTSLRFEGAVTSSYFSSLFSHFGAKTISVFRNNLNALAGTSLIYAGRVTTAGQERTVITLINLTLTTSNSNNRFSAQVEMFDSGVITITYITPTTWDQGLVGLSNVTTFPSSFAETNLSEYASESNLAPVFVTLPPGPAVVGQAWTHTVRTSEPNNQSVTITAPTKPAWLTLVDHGDGTATLSGTASASGTYPVTLQVSDGTLSTTQSFNVIASPASGNRAPVFTSSPPTAGSSGDTLTYQIQATDADGHTLTFSAANLPGWLTLTNNGNGQATLSGVIPTDLPATNEFAVTVSDGLTFATQSWTMTINRRPQIQLLRPLAARPWLAGTDLKLVLQARVTDDGLPTNSLISTWSQVSGPGTSVFDHANALDTVVAFPVAGTYVLRLTANDGTGGATLDIPVSVGASPVAPGGIVAEYFIGTALAGVPAVTRLDNTIDFATNSGTWPPAPAVSSNLSVRWTGWIIPDYSENYSIIPNVDDGARVWVNGVKVADEWTGGAPRDLATTPIALQAGQPAKIVMEYYNGGGGSAKLQWQSASRSKQVIPAGAWRSEDPAYNRAPVLAGLSDQDGLTGAAVPLIPQVDDDGKPIVPGLVTYAWEKVSGPLDGQFGDALSATTTFAAGTAGSYGLRLTADDGELAVARQITLNLIPPVGSYDSWLAGYPGLTGPATGREADPDGDGLNNLLEYALKLDPTGGGQTGHPSASGTDHLAITYRQRRGGSGTVGVDYVADGISYVVETTGSLSQPWVTGPAEVEAVGTPVDNGDGTETVTVRRKTPVTSGPGFIRLKVTVPQ